MLTARPSAEEEVRAPHRLFGHIDGAVAHNAAAWAAEAKAAIADVHAGGGVPILVGGTGLYLRTLLDGIAPVPEIDAQVRAEVRALPVAEAHRQLAQEDSVAAVRLRPSDTTRVARALEVVRSTGRTLSDWQADRIGGIGRNIRLAAAILLPDRDALAARIDARFETMLTSAAAEEVDALLARNLDPALPVMRAIGVREIAAWRTGAIDRATMTAQAQAASRQYAKRQRTWFRHQPPPDWLRIAQSFSIDDSKNVISCLVERLTQ